ncbi:MAG: D-lyxose/D-mannose family sugar isomerase [Candidatus Izemoplasmatales bacterium]
MNQYVAYVLQKLEEQKIVLTEDQKQDIEIADFGLKDFEHYGLGIYTYVNNDLYCAKELVMLPNQICPEHRHPEVGSYKGKQETFRCRQGIVDLYVDMDGEETVEIDSSSNYTSRTKIRLYPGQQFTIPRNTKHWFQAGPEGAIVSEFSSTSIDEADIFTDKNIKRVE